MVEFINMVADHSCDLQQCLEFYKRIPLFSTSISYAMCCQNLF